MQAKNIVESEMNRANKGLLKQVQQAIDSRIKDIEILSTQIALNPRLQGIMYAKEPISSFERYAMYNISQDFKVYKNANRFINSFYVFFDKIDSVLAYDGVYSKPLLYKTFHESDKMTYDKWYGIVTGKYSGNYIAIDGSKDENESKEIAFIQSLPYNSGNDIRATLVVILDKNYFQQAISNIKLVNQGAVMILDKGNNILSSTQPQGLPVGFNYDSLPDLSGLIYKNLGEEEYAISYIKSETLDWKYISVVPTRIFMERVKYMRKLTVMGVLICFSLSGLAALFFTRRNYNPLGEIIRIINKEVKLPFNKAEDEYSLIINAIRETILEKENMNKRLEQQNEILKSNFLFRMLRGNIPQNISVHDLLSAYNISFISENFAVAVFYIENYDGLFPEENYGDPEEKIKLIQRILNNIIDELIGEDNQAFMIEHDDITICLINLKDISEQEQKKELNRIFLTAQKLLLEKFKLNVTISISGSHKSFIGISNAYQEAIEALEYKLVMGSGNIIHYDSIKESRQAYFYSLEMEQRLMNSIRSGDYEKSKEVLEYIFETNFSTTIPSIEMTKCLMFGLVNTMMKTMDQISIVCDTAFIKDLDPVKRLLRCKTIVEMKVQMSDILDKICKYIVSVRKKNNNIKLKEQITEYIINNYTDMNLGVAGIADEFQMNPVQMSRLYKEQSGKSILDFINEIRIEKAKCLLKEENYNIGDAGTAVGYYNSNAFIRAFKKYEGITPGKYKELL
jgi:YesN/AraC family two-component response regulator